jgi:hypothetical protein
LNIGGKVINTTYCSNRVSDKEVSQENRLWPYTPFHTKKAPTSIKIKNGYIDNLSEEEVTQYEAWAFWAPKMNWLVIPNFAIDFLNLFAISENYKWYWPEIFTEYSCAY